MAVEIATTVSRIGHCREHSKRGKSMWRARKQVVFAGLALTVLSAATFGQSGTATLSGKVTDPAGLAISGANVETVNSDTTVAYPTTSNDAGLYRLSSLPPDRYQLKVRSDNCMLDGPSCRTKTAVGQRTLPDERSVSMESRSTGS